MPTFIVKVPAGLGPLLLADLPAVHHVRPPAGLLLLLPPLQGLYEVVAAVRADEARLNQARGQPEEQRGREKECKYTAHNRRAFGNTPMCDSPVCRPLLEGGEGQVGGKTPSKGWGGHAHFEQSGSTFPVLGNPMSVQNSNPKVPS